ncbi:hypothetical protein [Bradyrhizobium sp. CCBAU 53380]|uniref:hypothetical protein n=1 Tax=Bradyrhizobium sp. CCBAU 53380 TaxID=1325117 RepID=UPI00230268B7|nr:hypothetical protein [Bradyrhizobium sp. CCBAU 53380]
MTALVRSTARGTKWVCGWRSFRNGETITPPRRLSFRRKPRSIESIPLRESFGEVLDHLEDEPMPSPASIALEELQRMEKQFLDELGVNHPALSFPTDPEEFTLIPEQFSPGALRRHSALGETFDASLSVPEDFSHGTQPAPGMMRSRLGRWGLLPDVAVRGKDLRHSRGTLYGRIGAGRAQ